MFDSNLKHIESYPGMFLDFYAVSAFLPVIGKEVFCTTWIMTFFLVLTIYW